MSLLERIKNFKLPEWSPKPPARDVAIVLQQMSIMLKNGLDMASTLDTLAEQQNNKRLEKALLDIRNEVIMKGSSVSHGMRLNPDLFPPTVMMLCRAGEQGGDLVGCLQEGGELLERMDELTRQIKSGLTSPLMTCCAGLIMLLLVVKLVFPRFLSLYDQMELELPAITKAVLFIVAFLNHPIFLVTVAVAAGLIYKFRKPLVQEGFKIGVQIPPVAYVIGTVLCAQFCRVIACLYKAGIPLNRTLHLIADSSPFDLHRVKLQEVCKRLRTTGSFSESIEAVPYFPTLLNSMCSVGEESGALEEMMSSVQAVLDQEIELMLESLVNVLEPVFICIIGVVMCFFFVGMFLPIYDMLMHLGPA